MKIIKLAIPLILSFTLLLFQYANANANQNDDLNYFYSLSLDELLKVKVIELATLTPTSFHNSPAAISRISQEQIQGSGARTLFELLDIYVPGFQWIHHQWGANHMGVRGVISNDDDKVLLSVNGRVMNERTHFGAVTERDFPIMSDIYSIDVIRGAGSSMHGLGAVSMVIDIKTHNAKSQKSNSIRVQRGEVYQFNAIEAQLSKTFDNDLGIYLYAGIADVHGANVDDAPIIYGADITTPAGDFLPAGTPIPGPEANDGAQYKDKPPVKLHLQLSKNDTEFWLRFTRAGERQIKDVSFWSAPASDDALKRLNSYLEVGGQQLTAMLEHRFRLSEDFTLTAEFSYDTQDNQRITPSASDEPNYANSHREDEWFTKFVAQWKINDNHDLAFGSELSHETFGLKTHGDGASSPVNPRLPNTQTWSTNTASLMAEWQWRIDQDLTSYLGGRVDKNRYSDVLYSPRFSVVYNASKQDTLKFMLTRSRRMNGADENRASALQGETSSESETLDSIEVRYEHHKKNTLLALSTYYIKLDAFGWDNSIARAALVGEQTQWGSEFELKHEGLDYTLSLSHAYSKLLDFNLTGGDTLITAKPYGFGNDLASWSNHITKLNMMYSLNSKLSLNSSLRYYWGYPGSQDFRDKYVTIDETTRVKADWEEGYGKQVFLNFGGIYKLASKTRLQLNFYNTLGWIDKDLNKRHVTDSWGFYRSEAAAVALSLHTEF
jgi:iron complex outermembrane receptor protein